MASLWPIPSAAVTSVVVVVVVAVVICAYGCNADSEWGSVH